MRANIRSSDQGTVIIRSYSEIMNNEKMITVPWSMLVHLTYISK